MTLNPRARAPFSFKTDGAILLALAAALFFVFWRYFLPPGEELLVFKHDTLAYSYWWSYFFNKFLSQGAMPLWNHYVSLGYPAVAQVSNNTLYPLALPLKYFFTLDPLKYLRLFQLYAVSHFALAAAGTYLLLRTGPFSRLACALGALVYSLAAPPHQALDGFEWLYGYAWFPFSLALLLLARERGQARWWVLLGVSQGILYSTNFLPGLYQETVLLSFFLLLLFYRDWRRPWWLLWFGLSHLLAACLAAPSLLPLLDFMAGYSERAKAVYSYAVSGLAPDELWGRFVYPLKYYQFKTAYFGIAAYLLALAAILTPRALPRFSGKFFLLGLFIFLFGSGSYFMAGDFFYNFLPGYSTQHWHFRITLYLGLCFAWWAAAGLDYFSTPVMKLADRRVLTRVFGTLLLLAAAALLTRKELFSSPTLWGGLGVVLVFSLTAWLKLKNRMPYAAPVFFALLLTELLFVTVKGRPITAAPLGELAAQRHKGADLILAGRADYEERYFQGLRLPNGINTGVLTNSAQVRGYVTPDMGRTAEFYASGFMQDIWGGRPDAYVSTFHKAFISPADKPAFLRLAYGARLFLAGSARYAAPAPGEPAPAYRLRLLNTLASMDTTAAVLLEEAPPPAPAQRSPAARADSVTVTAFRPGLLQATAAVSGAAPKWLVFVDSWHRGWQASVNGAPARVYRADYNFKAVLLPPGESSVTFKFVPPFYFVLTAGPKCTAFAGN